MYELEREMLFMNFNDPDKGRVALNMLKCLRHRMDAIISYVDSLHEEKGK